MRNFKARFKKISKSNGFSFLIIDFDLIINSFIFTRKKALEKELGENYDIKSILSGQSNWKGRNQQIRTLQSKVK